MHTVIYIVNPEYNNLLSHLRDKLVLHWNPQGTNHYSMQWTCSTCSHTMPNTVNKDKIRTSPGSPIFANIKLAFTLCILETHKKDTLLNSEDPDEIQQVTTFHKGLHGLLRLKEPSETEIYHNLENFKFLFKISIFI